MAETVRGRGLAERAEQDLGSQRYLETKDTGTQCKQEKRQSHQPQGTSLVSKSKAQLSLMILFSFSKMYLA